MDDHDTVLDGAVQVGYINIINVSNNIYGTDSQQQTDSSSSIKPELYTDLISELKNTYRYYTLPTVAWLEERNLDLEKYFVDLELAESETPLKIPDIFKFVKNKKPLRVLIEGQPGFGKTTLATKIAFDWAMGKDYVNFELVVLVPLRQLRTHKYGNAIVSTENNEIREILDKNADKTLLILDGLDEIMGENREIVNEILYKKRHPQVTVVVFSRSNVFLLNRHERKILGGVTNMTDKYYDKRVAIIGIRDMNSKEIFLNNVCPQKSVKILQNHNLLNSKLLDSPLCLMLVSVTIDDLHDGSTKTDFYKCLFNAVIKQSYMNRDCRIGEDFDLFDSRVNDTKNCICEFGKICIGKIIEGNFRFENDDLIQKVYEMGFLTKQNEKISELRSRDYFEAFHLSIMEFAAAIYLWQKRNFSENLKQSILEHFLATDGTSQILPFLAGFVKNEKELDWLLSELDHYKWTFKCGIERTAQLLMHCPVNVVFKSKRLKSFIPLFVDVKHHMLEEYLNVFTVLLDCDVVKEIRIREKDIEKFSAILMRKTEAYLEILDESNDFTAVCLMPFNQHAQVSSIGLFRTIVHSTSIGLDSCHIWLHEYNKLDVITAFSKLKNVTLQVDYCKKFDTKKICKLLEKDNVIDFTLLGYNRTDVSDVIRTAANMTNLSNIFLQGESVDLHDLTDGGKKKYDFTLLACENVTCKYPLINKNCCNGLNLTKTTCSSENIKAITELNPLRFTCREEFCDKLIQEHQNWSGFDTVKYLKISAKNKNKFSNLLHWKNLETLHIFDIDNEEDLALVIAKLQISKLVVSGKCKLLFEDMNALWEKKPINRLKSIKMYLEYDDGISIVTELMLGLMLDRWNQVELILSDDDFTDELFKVLCDFNVDVLDSYIQNNFRYDHNFVVNIKNCCLSVTNKS